MHISIPITTGLLRVSMMVLENLLARVTRKRRNGSHQATLDNMGSFIEKSEKNCRPSCIVCNFDNSNYSNVAIASPDGNIDPPKPDPLSRENRR